MQLDRIDVHRLVADRLPGFRQVDDFREALLGEVRIHAAQRLERLPYRVLRQIGQPWMRQKLHDPGREVLHDVLGTNASLFRHFHFLSQFVADALQALAHGRLVHAGLRRQAGGCPLTVIPAIAELALLRCERQQRRREPVTLCLGPAALGLIQNGYVRDVVERHKRHAPGPTHVERDRNHDASQPARERGRLLQIAQPAKRPQVGLLGRILGRRRITQHAEGHTLDHPLRGFDQARVRLDVAALGSNDEIGQGLHRVLPATHREGHAHTESVTSPKTGVQARFLWHSNCVDRRIEI